jgi:hypothetical protein
VCVCVCEERRTNKRWCEQNNNIAEQQSGCQLLWKERVMEVACWGEAYTLVDCVERVSSTIVRASLSSPLAFSMLLCVEACMVMRRIVFFSFPARCRGSVR